MISDIVQGFAEEEKRRREFNGWLLQADESAIQKYAQSLQREIADETGVELHLTLSRRLLSFLKPEDIALVNGHSYRMAIIESDRSSVTDGSTELLRDNHVVGIDTSLHSHRTGPLWNTTAIPCDKSHRDGERGNRAGRRGKNPGVQAEEASCEILDAFRTEIVETVAALLQHAKTRIAKNENRPS